MNWKLIFESILMKLLNKKLDQIKNLILSYPDN